MANFGINGLQKLPGGVYKVELSGFANYDVSYSGVFTGNIPFVQGDTSDDWPNLVLMSIAITETGTACDHVKLDLHYEGKDTVFTTPETSLDLSVDFTTSQEPIESHPDFVSLMGGTPDDPKHGAFYDLNTGEFLGFPVVDPDEPDTLPSRFAGVRSYLLPQETFVANSVEFDYPSSAQIESIGKVYTPTTIDGTPLPLPALPGERNWLNSGIRVQNIANVYFRTQVTGQLSGPRKWLVEAYGAG